MHAFIISLYDIHKVNIIEDLVTLVLLFIEIIKRVGEKDKMRGLPSNLSLFLNEFNKINNRGAPILNYFLSYTCIAINLLLKSHFCRKNVMILSLCT